MKRKKILEPRLQPGGAASKPLPKIVTTPLVQLAKEAKLNPQELSDFVTSQAEELKQLQILNAKTSITGFGLNTVELDALLSILDTQENKQLLATAILTASGLKGRDLETFALKLARMGVHQ